MAEFCTCGSLVVNSQCTNKNCVHRVNEKASPSRSTITRSKSASVTKKTASKEADTSKQSKTANVRRSSKCVTYSLEELQKREGNIY